MRHPRTRILAASLLCAVATFLAAPAFADTPSLDDLLNLPKPGKPAPGAQDKPADAAPPPGQNERLPLDPEVKKRLSEKQISDLYRAALADMKVAAERLSEKRDAGADTQNAQKEAIDKLARLITDLERQQQSNSKPKPGSSSDSSQGPQSESDKGNEGNSSKPGSQSDGSGKNSGNGKGSGKDKPGTDGKKGDEPTKMADGSEPGKGDKTNPGRESNGDVPPPNGGSASGTPTTPLAEAKANWGNLPPRVRDELLEGVSEKFSPVYREMTESYYKRLAEEKK